MASSSSTNTSSLETRQSRFEQGVALSLNLWPALTLAVQNQWGGPDSVDKRDWFAGQVVEQFPEFTKAHLAPKEEPAQRKGSAGEEEPDAEYIEELLLQVMLDEFEVNVDDVSGLDVATEIIRIRSQCAKGNFEEVDNLFKRWESRKGVNVGVLFKKVEDQDSDADWATDDDEEEDGAEDGAEDIDIDEAPQLVSTTKEKPPPEVDEDGFTKVTRKR